jgi:hypothetical protein
MQDESDKAELWREHVANQSEDIPESPHLPEPVLRKLLEEATQALNMSPLAQFPYGLKYAYFETQFLW